MDELRKYVDGLFARLPQTAENAEFREEVYANMSARREDVLAQGSTEQQALSAAKKALPSVEGVTGDAVLVSHSLFRTHSLMELWFYSAVLFILTLPTYFLGHRFLSGAVLAVTIIAMVSYFISKQSSADTPVFLHFRRWTQIRRRTWQLWGLAFGIWVIFISAVSFGSNLWFSRPVHINGPYQLALLLMRYYLPALSIFIPLYMGRLPRILTELEKQGHDF